MDAFRQRSLLLFFIEHLLDVSITSRKLSAIKQAIFYLKHTWYLTKLLEQSASKADAINYQSIIKSEEEICKRLSANELTVPMTPKRNSSMSFPKELLIRNATINQQNLSTSYNTGLDTVGVSRSNSQNSEILRKPAPEKRVKIQTKLDFID